MKKYEEIAIVTTDSIIGETISETVGYASAIDLNWFYIRKTRAVERSIDMAFQKLQYQALKDGADAVVRVRTNVEFQGQYLLYTRVNVFVEGTLVSLAR